MRLLFVGWDAADWKVIDPLLARGEMPHLAALLAQGVRGNSSTIYPPLSPMVWTSIATGKRPTKHGIHGFIEPTEDGLAVRPVSNLGRKTKAFWNILNQEGKNCIVIGWWPSHPAEPIRGAMVSNHFPLTTANKPDRPLMPGTISPPALAGRLADLRVHPSELNGDILRLFVPDWQKVDQDKDKSLHDLAGIIAETMSIHAAATELMETEPWDLAAVYFSGIDHFSHRFMRYHARKRSRTAAAHPALFRDIVANAYRYHDLMLGRLIQLAGPDTAVMVASDHGFHSDGMLPDYIPAEAAGPAVEHRDFGIFCLKGAGVRQGENIHGVSVLDIAPTILHLFGLPVGTDMDGKVLINAFGDQSLPARIPTWDDVQGNDGRHPPERHYDGASSVESLRQLVDLGYISPPSGDAAKMAADCVAESRYNLARAHMDAGDLDPAAEILQDLIADDADQMRYHQHLFNCRLAQRRYDDCAQLLDRLDETCPAMAARAADELKRRRTETQDKALANSDNPSGRRELFDRRALAEKLGGHAFERLLMRCTLLLARAKTDDKQAARPLLDQLAASRRLRRPLAMFLAQSYSELGDDAQALDWIRRIRRIDRDNWRAIALEARIHYKAGRFRDAADRAVDSLALVYFQPAVHHLLGAALLELNDVKAAEQEFQVALAQAPGFVAAHNSLAAMLRRDPARLGEASVHMARAEQLRTRRPQTPAAPRPDQTTRAVRPFERGTDMCPGNRDQTIIIVAGLPRSGTSMMMQILAAGGIAPHTDNRRAADPDNPRGYYEHSAAMRLHQDTAWVSEAHGKALKIVAPLLLYLPPGEQYRLIFMHRPLDEIVASQHAMLQRLGRSGGRLNGADLGRALTSQLVRIQNWLEWRAEIPVLAVGYPDAIADPSGIAIRLARFLGEPFDVCGAGAAIDASLRHQRST